MTILDASRISEVKRLWILMPGRKDAYVPGFEGTFDEVLKQAICHASFWNTVVTIYEADPENYRRANGLKKSWAVIRLPKDSPLRDSRPPE